MKRIEPQEFRYAVTPADYTGMVTVDDCRAFTIVDQTNDSAIDTADTTLIQALIDSAIRYWIDYTGVFPIHTSITAQLDYSPGDYYSYSGLDYIVDCWMKYEPIASVTKIWAINDDTTENELAAADYVVDTENAIIRSKDWPTGTKDLGSFNITYAAGLSALAANVPEDVKTAIKMMVTHWFEIRQPGIEESIKIVPHHAQAIMEKYKPSRL